MYSTPEQERSALVATEKTLRDVRDVLMRLDLPVSELGTAMRVFDRHLDGELSLAISKAEDERRGKERELKTLLGGRRMGSPLDHVDYMSIDELDAEIARIKAG